MLVLISVVEVVPPLMIHMVMLVIQISTKKKKKNKKCLNLISAVNKTRFLYQHESSDCKYRLNKSVCNSKQKWNHNEFRYKNVKNLIL